MLVQGDRRGVQGYRGVQAVGGVRIARTSGLPRERLATDLGVGKAALLKWISQYQPSDLAAAPQADLARDNERLRVTAVRALPAAENRVLKEEGNIL